MPDFAMAGAIHVVPDADWVVSQAFTQGYGGNLFSAPALETYYFGMYPHSFSDGYSADYEGISGSYRSEPLMQQWKGGNWSAFSIDLFVSNSLEAVEDAQRDPRFSQSVIRRSQYNRSGVSLLQQYRDALFNQNLAQSNAVSGGSTGAVLNNRDNPNPQFPSVLKKVLWLESLALPQQTRALDSSFGGFVYNTVAAKPADLADARPPRVMITSGSWLLKTGYISSVEITYLAPYQTSAPIVEDNGAYFTLSPSYEPMYAEVRLTMIQHGKYATVAKNAAGPMRSDLLKLGVA